MDEIRMWYPHTVTVTNTSQSNDSYMKLFTMDFENPNYHLVCDFRPAEFFSINGFELKEFKYTELEYIKNQNKVIELNIEYNNNSKSLFVETRHKIKGFYILFTINGSPLENNLKDILYDFRDEFLKRIKTVKSKEIACVNCIFYNEYLFEKKCLNFFNKKSLIK